MDQLSRLQGAAESGCRISSAKCRKSGSRGDEQKLLVQLQEFCYGGYFCPFHAVFSLSDTLDPSHFTIFKSKTKMAYRTGTNNKVMNVATPSPPICE